MNIRIHIFISGKVQGVCFRYYTKTRAEELGVFGWVRNLPDGRVETVLEGEKEEVEKIVDWCRKGPEHARVTGLEAIEENYINEFNNFSQLR